MWEPLTKKPENAAALHRIRESKRREINMNTELKISHSDLYETDYYLWIHDTVEKLKHQSYDQVDWVNLLDEIEHFPRECPYSIDEVLEANSSILE